MPELPQGTKEYLIVDVEDELGAIADLSSHNPEFRVINPDPTDTDKVTWTNVGLVVTLMKVRCLVDTSSGGGWPPGTYRLQLRFTATPELPWLGPYEFDVVGI
jgi:hypothetical protein